MGYALPITQNMVDMTCGACGIAFAVPEHWHIDKVREGGSFHCPNGCQRRFKEPLADKLKRELADEQRRHADTLARLNDSQAAQHKLQREAIRLRTRAANGVCPCCTRSFVNLQRHMTTRHPDYSLTTTGSTP